MKPMDPSVSLQAASPRLPSADSLRSKSREELKEAAKQFETMFMNLVVKQMRQAVPDSGLLGENSKVHFFQGMLDEEYSRLAGENKSNGLSQMIYQNLLKMQGIKDED
ncbi:MAG: flagellar biosynthesis protein FlgJ [Bradymonadales bacterium]|nr:MAG: flagellar biosynthesis protein FlgJ [Bradymonadales bacterium]